MLIIAVACLGKFGGSTLAARACGFAWRESAAIGILMNTRGLMELVILNIGRELGVITDAVFAMMVIMALVTTALTTPMLAWVYPERHLASARASGTRARAFSVLIPTARGADAGALLRLAQRIAGAPGEEHALVALHVARPAEHEAYRAALASAGEHGASDTAAPLAALLAEARANGIALEPMAVVGQEVADAVNAVAGSRKCDLVLLRYGQPLIGRNVLGGTVHRVLAHATSDVAVFVDKGLAEPRRILVPFLGGRHDRLALELAQRIGRHTNVEITVLHVVARGRDPGAQRLGAKTIVESMFDEASGSVALRVVEDDRPVEAVLSAASEADLVVIGISEKWGLGSHLFGFRRERIVEQCGASLLVVRKGAEPVLERATSATRAPAPTPS